MAGLQHPNILQILGGGKNIFYSENDATEAGDKFYTVTEIAE